MPLARIYERLPLHCALHEREMRFIDFIIHALVLHFVLTHLGLLLEARFPITFPADVRRSNTLP